MSVLNIDDHATRLTAEAETNMRSCFSCVVAWLFFVCLFFFFPLSITLRVLCGF